MAAITIRTITESDAQQFLTLCKQLDEETHFMMLEPDERTTTLAEQQARISEVLANGNSTILVAESAGILIGYIGAYGEHFRKCRHSAYVVIGVLAAHHGGGIGTRLFEALEKWAKSARIHRLELTVMVHNAAGIALYKKAGFVPEGIKRHSLMMNNSFTDEYYMAKLL